MLHLLPVPKKLTLEGETVSNHKISADKSGLEERLSRALDKLPLSPEGIRLEIEVGDGEGEGYTLRVSREQIVLKGDSAAGVFYGIQTLRQIYAHDEIPCLYIEDRPDFGYRGFYQDITRGKVPTVNTLKKLIDQIAAYKLNSLQLYVEHTFAFREYEDSMERTGFLTADEIRELDDYCYENFVEFIPSLSCFGHLYELLEKKQYRYLREMEDFEPKEIFWHNRMGHHTIDPVNPDSLKLITGMIDQYMPLFRSDKFNICCDETFDLNRGKHKGMDTGKLYVDFVSSLIRHVQGKGKTVMMWADILLQHPECIGELPDGILFLNWNYDREPSGEQVEAMARLRRPQIVCPGTGSWSRLAESVEEEKSNIAKMAEYGYENGALGVLTTNWGDWGNPCCLELAMYGLILGAQKSWSVSEPIGEEFEASADALLYHHPGGVECLKTLDRLHRPVSWNTLAKCYSNRNYERKFELHFPEKDILLQTRKGCRELIGRLAGEKWGEDEYRQEMLLAAEGVGIMAGLLAREAGYELAEKDDVKEWLRKYREKWVKKNKESELCEIEKMFRGLGAV